MDREKECTATDQGPLNKDPEDRAAEIVFAGLGSPPNTDEAVYRALFERPFPTTPPPDSTDACR